jgi:hypothetical protein
MQMNKKLIGITILAVLVSLVQLTASTGGVPKVFASKLAGIVGAGSTGVQVQNLDAVSATDITMDLYPQGGAAPTQLIKNAPAGGSATFYLPSEGIVADGAYAAIVSAVKPIAAIARTEWPSVGGAATYGNVPPSMNVLIPLATKAFAGQTSQFSVQNTDTGGNASITVMAYQTGSSSPAVSFSDTVLPGTSKTYDLGSSSQFSGLAAGFLGSIKVTGDKNLAVQSFVDFVGGSKAVYAFSGVDSASAAIKLYAPLVRRAFAGATTGISIVNPNATAVSVHITYKHNPASGDPGDYVQDISIAGNSSAVAYQGTGPMPTNWLGSAVLDATGGPIVAMVNDATGTTSAAYNAPSTADGGKIVSVPLVRNKQTSAQLTTGVQVMNVGAGTATVTINYKSSGGTSYGPETASVPQYGSATFYQPSGPFPVGAYGSATVTCPENVVVIVNDISLTGAFDAAIYNGIKAD